MFKFYIVSKSKIDSVENHLDDSVAEDLVELLSGDDAFSVSDRKISAVPNTVFSIFGNVYVVTLEKIMDTGKFISDYIVESCAEGFTSNKEILERAKNEIAQIDAQLKKADDLKLRRLQLISIVTHYGDDSFKRKVSGQEQPVFEDDDISKAFRPRIIEVIKDKGPLTNREIIQLIGSYRDDVPINRAIKWLGVNGIVQRDGTPENRIVPGPSWETASEILTKAE